MPNQFFSPEGDIENYFVSEYWLIDQYIGDELWTWGLNDIGYGFGGMLGNNSITNASTPVTTFSGGTNWNQVSTGRYHTAAIKTDGTLWTWGSTTSFPNSFTPVTTFAGGTNWKQVSCSSNYVAQFSSLTVAIKTDGTLWLWGDNYYGEFGSNASTGSTNTPVTTFAGGTNWKQVSCGSHYVAAIKTDGTLWTWGNGVYGVLGTNDVANRSTPVTTFAGGTNWKQVSSGRLHIAAIKTDGTLWTWGGGFNGRLGNFNTTNRSTPVTTFAGGTNWKQVSAGDGHTAAIKTYGTLWTWGRGIFSGALGTNDASNKSTPVTTFAGGTNWKQVSCGSGHTAAIKTDGTLWTWGYGANGNLGNAQLTSRSTPVTTFAGGSSWKQLSSDGYHTAAVKTGIIPDLPLS